MHLKCKVLFLMELDLRVCRVYCGIGEVLGALMFGCGERHGGIVDVMRA